METATFSHSTLRKAMWALTSATSGHYMTCQPCLFGSYFSLLFNRGDLTFAEKAISIIPKRKASNLLFYFSFFFFFCSLLTVRQTRMRSKMVAPRHSSFPLFTQPALITKNNLCCSTHFGVIPLHAVFILFPVSMC